MRIRKVIGGKVFDTDTAELLCNISGHGGTLSRSDFGWEDTGLYRTKKGRFFIAGQGGACSRWSEPSGNNGMQGGQGLALIDDEAAKREIEAHGDPDMFAAVFGAPEEG